MATVIEWMGGARLHTLPAAATPVLVGTGAAAQIDRRSGTLALLALGVALALQVGVNYANDYSDGVRGTDMARVGPRRLTGSGLAPARQVLTAALVFFGIGGAIGIVLSFVSGHAWLIAVGAACVGAAWYYTGGARPYGYRGFGEVSVFLFFGLVAVIGTAYTQADRITVPAVLGGIAVGLLASALLLINNIRDIPTDTVAGKRTLAVRLGDIRARWLYLAMIWLPIVLGVACAFWATWSLLVLLMVLPAAVLTIAVVAGAQGKLLVPVLFGTALYELGFGVLLGFGLAV